MFSLPKGYVAWGYVEYKNSRPGLWVEGQSLFKLVLGIEEKGGGGFASMS